MSQRELNAIFIDSLSSSVVSHSDLTLKPLEINLKPPLPVKVRVYIYNMTQPMGERSLGDHKIQLIVPGQKRGERANFDGSKGRIILLCGYESDLEVFSLWDAGLYPDFSYSRNVQVRANTIYKAFAGSIGIQERDIRGQGKEVVITANQQHLKEAIILRIRETQERIVGRNLFDFE